VRNASAACEAQRGRRPGKDCFGIAPRPAFHPAELGQIDACGCRECRLGLGLLLVDAYFSTRRISSTYEIIPSTDIGKVTTSPHNWTASPQPKNEERLAGQSSENYRHPCYGYGSGPFERSARGANAGNRFARSARTPIRARVRPGRMSNPRETPELVVILWNTRYMDVFRICVLGARR
jgi:hypothetical protein